MKLLTAVAPAVLIVGLMGCSTNYDSKWEAGQACREWSKQEQLEERIGELRVGGRWCREEEETRQHLGFEHVKTVKEDGLRSVNPEVVKYFRY